MRGWFYATKGLRCTNPRSRHPVRARSGVHYSASVGIKVGIWLGLIAALGLTYGGYLGMQDEGTSLSDVREQASGALSGMSAAVAGSGSADANATSTETPAPPVPPPAAAPAPEPPEGTPA